MDELQTEASVPTSKKDGTRIDPMWNLCEDFTIHDAAALAAGYDPTLVNRYHENPVKCEEYPRYAIAFTALKNAITNNRLTVTLRHSAREYGDDDRMADTEFCEVHYMFGRGTTAKDDEIICDSEGKTFFYKTFPDWELSTVSRNELVRWLSSRGIKSGFFFSGDTDQPSYLDSAHPRYAPKLAAAVNAWLALDDEDLIKGKSPKQGLQKWLREHAAQFNLSGDEGKPNEQGIEECAKVANWREKGGAPKTPAY